MKKLFFAMAVVCLFAFAAFAQKSADLSGKWNLDLTKSDLGQQAAMIKSQTVTITQSGTSFKVSTATERNTPPEFTQAAAAADAAVLAAAATSRIRSTEKKSAPRGRRKTAP